jgi:Protein of unknown function (DUF3073)
MGRGRAKAKQAKVARQLKYSGGGTDLDRLRAELGVDSDQRHADGDSDYTDLADRYSVDDDSLDEEDEEEDWSEDADLDRYDDEDLLPQSSSQGRK